MANNRMWLACPCGGRFLIGKCLADNWYVPPYFGPPMGQDLQDSLNLFYLEHENCEPRVCGGTVLRLEFEETVDTPTMTRRPCAALEGE